MRFLSVGTKAMMRDIDKMLSDGLGYPMNRHRLLKPQGVLRAMRIMPNAPEEESPHSAPTPGLQPATVTSRL